MDWIETRLIDYFLGVHTMLKLLSINMIVLIFIVFSLPIFSQSLPVTNQPSTQPPELKQIVSDFNMRLSNIENNMKTFADNVGPLTKKLEALEGKVDSLVTTTSGLADKEKTLNLNIRLSNIENNIKKFLVSF